MSVTSSCVHILTHFGGFRVREHFSRARFHPFGRVSRSRELLACMFSPFWTGFAFARTSRVHVLTLLDEFRVRENFSRTRSHPFGQVSRSRELLACSFSPFWMAFPFARTSRVLVPTLLGVFRVRENYLATTNPPPKKQFTPKAQLLGLYRPIYPQSQYKPHEQVHAHLPLNSFQYPQSYLGL
jgi:hypothetical protein